MPRAPFGLVRLVARVRLHLAAGRHPLTLASLDGDARSKAIWAALLLST